MVKPGDFVMTRYGVGLVYNEYIGNPDVFFGKEVKVGDIVYPDRITRQIEISGYLPAKTWREDYTDIIKGIFEEIYK